MKKIISLFGLILILQGCSSSYHRYSDYDDIYYDDYYYDTYYYDDDYYSYNYYPDRWGMNYSNVYYSPYRYPRVGFYNHYYYSPNSYWGSYSPWGGYYAGINYGWSLGFGYTWSNYHWHSSYYHPYSSYYYSSYWDRYWNNHYTRRHITARNEVARLAARNRHSSSYGYNRNHGNYRDSNRRYNQPVSRDRLRPSNRARTSVGTNRSRTPSQQPFTGVRDRDRNRSAQRPVINAPADRTSPSTHRTHPRSNNRGNSNEPIVIHNRPRTYTKPSVQQNQRPATKPVERYRGSIYNRPISSGQPSQSSQRPAINPRTTIQRPGSSSIQQAPRSNQRPSSPSRPVYQAPRTKPQTQSRPSSKPSSKPQRSSSRSSSSRDSSSRNSSSRSSSSRPSSSGKRSSSSSELRRRR